MNEPDSGSDLASLKTFAENDGDQWIINGQKIWKFFAQADYMYLFAEPLTTGRT